MAREIEIKLAFAPEARRAVERHPLLIAAKVGRASHRELYSAYFDTVDRRLVAAGAALRIRKEGGRWVQTLKSADQSVGALHSRSETDWPIARGALALDVLGEHALFKARRSGERTIDPRRLRQAFVTRFLRTSFDIRLAEGTLAEVAIDSGVIEAARRSVPISEIEIELKEGDPLALIELSMALCADLQLRVEAGTKSARGFELANRVRALPAKARPLALQRAQTLGVAAGQMIASTLAQVQANERGAMLGRDVEYLHQLRVGLRRFRAVLSVCGGAFSKSDVNDLKARLDPLGVALGRARDWDVWCTETLPRLAAAFPELPDLRQLARVSQGERRAAQVALRQALASTDYACVVLLAARLALQAPRELAAAIDLGAYAERLLERRLTRLLERDPVNGDIAIRHRIRIEAKKLRYAADLLSGVFARPGARGPQRFVRAVGSVQDVLGRPGHR